MLPGMKPMLASSSTNFADKQDDISKFTLQYFAAGHFKNVTTTAKIVTTIFLKPHGLIFCSFFRMFGKQCCGSGSGLRIRNQDGTMTHKKEKMKINTISFGRRAGSLT
jgi:hypothetical protein